MTNLLSSSKGKLDKDVLVPENHLETSLDQIIHQKSKRLEFIDFLRNTDHENAFLLYEATGAYRQLDDKDRRKRTAAQINNLRVAYDADYEVSELSAETRQDILDNADSGDPALYEAAREELRTVLEPMLAQFLEDPTPYAIPSFS